MHGLCICAASPVRLLAEGQQGQKRLKESTPIMRTGSPHSGSKRGRPLGHRGTAILRVSSKDMNWRGRNLIGQNVASRKHHQIRTGHRNGQSQKAQQHGHDQGLPRTRTSSRCSQGFWGLAQSMQLAHSQLHEQSGQSTKARPYQAVSPRVAKVSGLRPQHLSSHSS